ncbi:hypothetical protein ABGB16_12645, partial [Micromonospora sp. B11E3]
SHWRAGRSGNHQIRFGGRPRGKGPAQRLAPRRAAHPSGWLVRNRRLARDYERLTANSEAMIKVAMIRLMTIRLAGQTIRWANATEREAAQRINVERLLAT